MVRRSRCRLTDTYIKAAKPAQVGDRDETPDLDRPRLMLRVTDAGHKSFVYLARFPGSPNPTRRHLGNYPSMSLSEAREKADKWTALLARGIDPRDDERREREEAEAARKAEELRRENTVANLSAKYLKQVRRRRQIKLQEGIIAGKLMPIWGSRPVDSITTREIKELIAGIAARGHLAMARNVLVVVKAFFSYAADLLEIADPAAPIRPTKLIGDKKTRTRVLTDAELSAVWLATGKMGYPWGPLYRLLILTGCRLREIAEARWYEIDDNFVLTIPPERFKTETPHLVPLTAAAWQILKPLSQHGSSDFIFSTTGKGPIGGFSKAKRRLDQLSGVTDFTVHDFRRTVRTGLAALNVPDTVAEAAIGHGRKGIQRVYDQHGYLPQVRKALELWSDHVLGRGEAKDVDEKHRRAHRNQAKA